MDQERIERRPVSADDPARQMQLREIRIAAEKIQAGVVRCVTCGAPAKRLFGAPGSATARAFCALDARVESQRLEHDRMKRR